MGRLRWTIAAFFLGASISACVSATFGYRYYNLEVVSYDGFLRGATAADDRPFEVCKPDPQDPQGQNKCTIMLTVDAYRLKQDYLSIKNDLIRCEQKNGQ